MEIKIFDIDVIVPIYNVEPYLESCIESLLSQTKPIRIILVNDGSKDGSGSIAQRLAAKNSEQILYIEQENAGLSAARNTGLKYVVAPYVAFMDSDDWVSSDYYAKLYKLIKENDAEIACSAISFAYERHIKDKKAHNLPQSMNQMLLYKQNEQDENFRRGIISIFPMAQNKLWKTDLIKKNGLQFLLNKQYEDLDFFYRAFLHTERIIFTEFAGFYYRQRPNSIVKTANERILEIMDVFDNVYEYFKEHEMFAEYRIELEYLLVRNCLVASAKRLAFSRKYHFIKKNIEILYDYVANNTNNWRKNKYFDLSSLRHLFIHLYYRKSLPLIAFGLKMIGYLLK